ncbi:MAG TPA: GFA family protein [Caulobacteraceae bacterium]|nr:GFA family protein [Caulobacteraceae bacterium]
MSDERPRPVLPLSGGCQCGAVRYEVSAPPLILYACHCTDCQRQSGAAFTLNMPVPAAAFRITKGEPAGWRRPNASGQNTTSWFCGACGGRIYGSRENRPEAHTLRAGTLDDTRWLKPVAHFFRRSAQPWERFDDGAPVFDTMPEDVRPLATAWRAQWVAMTEG